MQLSTQTWHIKWIKSERWSTQKLYINTYSITLKLKMSISVEPIHSYYVNVTNVIVFESWAIHDRGVIIGHFGNTLFQSKAALVMSLLAILYFYFLQQRQLESSLGQFHTASLFVERALLDLVRGLETLRGGWRKAYKQKVTNRVIMSCTIFKACPHYIGFFLLSTNPEVTKTNALVCL